MRSECCPSATLGVLRVEDAPPFEVEPSLDHGLAAK
jgi:hypothetical protein